MRAGLLVLAILCGIAAADPQLEALATDDPAALTAAVAAVEGAPAPAADTLFAAGRACEDRLLDPARALAIYERLVREQPHARVAAAAERRAERLRGTVGPGGAHATEARELAHLIANADALAADVVIGRAAALADRAWPGAPDAALWLAEFLRRLGRHAEAAARYAQVRTRWPNTVHAYTAQRGGAANALEAHDWAAARALAEQLPAERLDDRIVRDDLLASIARGQRLTRLYVASWVAAILAFAGLLASLAEAALRGGRRRPALRPPFEIWFFVPLAALFIAVAALARPAI